MTLPVSSSTNMKTIASGGAGETAEVQDFLDLFARALTSGYVRTLASMWETPALVVGNDEVRAAASAGDLEAFFSGAKEQYNSRGITDTRADIQRLDWVNERIAIVDVRWPYLDRHGREVGEEASTYTLRRNDHGELKLRVVVMRGAGKRVGTPLPGTAQH